jgi:TetR/AcrR family transcriptional regulator
LVDSSFSNRRESVRLPKPWRRSRREKRGVFRPRNPEATQRRILVAARQEFARKGLAGARVDVIARRARANKQLLYHYFGGKDGLYLAVLESGLW